MKKTGLSATLIRSAVFLSSIFAILLLLGFDLKASDLSDARTLRERCEKEIKTLEIAVLNFGTEKIKQDFQEGEKKIKLAKVKYIQTRYTEAIELYNGYLKLQYAIYRDLAGIYIDRTAKIIDDIGVELVDFVDNKKIEKYFIMASQNLNDAKKLNSSQHYRQVIDGCRQAKNYAISAYEVAGKKAPQQYAVDIQDNKNQINR